MLRFESQQYIPVNNRGEQVSLDPGCKIAYHARSFVWAAVPVTPKTNHIIGALYNHETYVQEYYAIMEMEATQADCERRAMGCVVTNQKFEIKGRGHNTKPSGMEGTCKQVGCVPALTCRLTDHAEAVTLRGINTESDAEGYILFNTAVPCLDCLKRCKERNVKIIVYQEAREQSEFDRPILSAVSMNSGISFIRAYNE